MKSIVFTNAALKQLLALPIDAQDAIDFALDRYAMSGHGDVKAITNSNSYRVQVGRYRLIFDEDGETILALYVVKRETTTYRKGRT